MTTNSKLESIKRQLENGTFTPEVFKALEKHLAESPCELESWLFLIDSLGNHRFDKFLDIGTVKHWSEYYNDAIEQHSNCWQRDDLISLHMLATVFYADDQNILKLNVTVKAMYQLDATNWKVVDSYVWHHRPILGVSEALPLIESIGTLAPMNNFARYRQGLMFERYFKFTQRSDIAKMAFEAYELSLKLGFAEETIPLVVLSIKRSIQELSKY